MKFLRSIFFLPVLLVLLGTKCNNDDPLPESSEVVAQTDPVINNDLSKDFIMGRFEPAEHPLFVEIDTMYADRAGLYLQSEAYHAFLDMQSEAVKEGISLIIRSATRNFEYQKGLWENKWTGNTLLEGNINAAVDIENEMERALEILKYSAMPGTSRHHWGTDIDLNAFNNKWFESGDGEKLYGWLIVNAHNYGFCQPYTLKDSLRPDGYNEEKWHWSYKPLAAGILDYARIELKNSDIQGFLGSEQAVRIDVKEKYILGINRECLESSE